MLWISLIYAIVSMVILLIILALVVWKQITLKSSAVYYLIVLIITIIGWAFGDMMQIIYSAQDSREGVLFFSRFATISSMIAMLSTVLFARVLTARRTLNSLTVAIAFLLFGAVVALTLGSGYTVLDPIDDVPFYKTEADFIWVILDALMVLYAGSLFLYYLIRQQKIVDKKFKGVLKLMMVGVIIAFFVSAGLYTIYAFFFVVETLHLEMVSAAIGAFLIGIAILKGGKEALYYSSRVYSLHIFTEDGIGVYAGVFQSGYLPDEQLISGVAAAISTFAAELIGQDVFPKEVDLGNYSLMLEKKGKYLCLVSSESPTAHLRENLKRIVEDFEESMSTKEISDLVERNISYVPRVLSYEY